MSKKCSVIALILLFVIPVQVSAIGINPNDPIFPYDDIMPLANLVLKTNGGGVRPDYALFIADYLRDIGIEVEIKIEEWSVFVGALLVTHDYDMGIVSISGGGASPDMRNIYTEAGNMNLCGLDTDIPYGNQSEQMQEECMTMMDLQTRQQHYYDWQQLMMDKIVPMLPLYTPQSFVGTWANTLGYDASWGIIDSLPYMSYDGYHEGQKSLTEFRIADANLRELNPMFIDSYFGYGFIGKTLNEELVLLSPSHEPIKTGLVRDWERIDDFHFKFYMRDNVFWNPSYNITERDEYSPPLNTIPTTQLARGLKSNEYSDGSNQQVTAKDAVFTLLLWGNPTISESTSYHEWISNIYVDPVDPLVFHVHIDEDPVTPEPDYYPDFWERLNWIVMPEFFLNSTDPTVSYSSGGVKCTGLHFDMINSPQWRMYSISQFGCGKYMLDYTVRNEKTVLQASPYWMGVGPKDGSIEDLDIETITVSVIVDASEELDAFRNGYLDWSGLRQFPSIRKQMQKDPRFNVQSFITSSMSFLFFNLQRPFIGGYDNFIYLDAAGKEEYTKAVSVRKAICYAIDREEMNEVIHNGDYLIAHSVLYPYTGYYYYDDIIKYKRDLKLASEWMGSCGYPVPDYTPTDNSLCCINGTTTPTSSLSYVTSIVAFVFIIVISLMTRRFHFRIPKRKLERK